MTNILRILRPISSEGHYFSHRLVRQGRHAFVALKCLRTTLRYAFRKGTVSNSPNIVVAKAANQLRHHQHTKTLITDRVGEHEVFSDTPSLDSCLNALPRMGSFDVLKQVFLLTALGLTGNSRYLSLYYLAFHRAMRPVVSNAFPKIETFTCYNDQPFDVASILTILHEKAGVRTAVIQHGLILSVPFYFPSIAKEFWAWGAASKVHYKTRHPRGELIITGRYVEDSRELQSRFASTCQNKKVRLLLAPSFKFEEVKDVVNTVLSCIPEPQQDQITLAIKFHPATKFGRVPASWLKEHAPMISIETENMEMLASRYDALVTMNSTSSVDFLLRGKPVFFTQLQQDDSFPSKNYGLSTDQIIDFYTNSCLEKDKLNDARLEFLNATLNVPER